MRRRGPSAPQAIPDILSFQHARRFWVLASFSLRAGAHVPLYAPLPCSRKPCQNAKLAGRACLSVWACAAGTLGDSLAASAGRPRASAWVSVRLLLAEYRPEALARQTVRCRHQRGVRR